MSPRLISRCAASALLGAVPGLLIATQVVQVGTAVALLGAAVGAVFGFSSLSPVRVLKLLVAFIIARNLPGSSQRVLNWVDTGEPVDDKSALDSVALVDWLAANDAGPPRGWLIGLGLLLGAVLGGGLMLADVRALNAGRAGLILPLPKAQDSLTTQALVMTICFTIWGGACAGVLASSRYRRTILFAASISTFLGSCIAVAAAQPQDGVPLRLVVPLTTTAVAVALFFAYAMSPENGSAADENEDLEN